MAKGCFYQPISGVWTGWYILPHAFRTEWRTCCLVSSARVNYQNCWCLGCGGWVFFVQWVFVTGSTTVSLHIRYSFTCWFTVHCAEATLLSPPHDSWASRNDRVTRNGRSIWHVQHVGRWWEQIALHCCTFSSQNFNRRLLSITPFWRRMTVMAVGAHRMLRHWSEHAAFSWLDRMCRFGSYRNLPFDVLLAIVEVLLLLGMRTHFPNGSLGWFRMVAVCIASWHRACFAVTVDCWLLVSCPLRITPMTFQKLST